MGSPEMKEGQRVEVLLHRGEADVWQAGTAVGARGMHVLLDSSARFGQTVHASDIAEWRPLCWEARAMRAHPLKHCPCCGAEAEMESTGVFHGQSGTSNARRVICRGCGLSGRVFDDWGKSIAECEEMAAGMWNQRVDTHSMRRES